MNGSVIKNVASLLIGDLDEKLPLSVPSELAQLREQNQKLKRALEAKNQFFAEVSHELRTPLTPVLFTVNALEGDSSLAPDIRNAIASIRRNVELQAYLIDDLLDVARITEGKMAVDPQLMDFNAAVENAVEICQPTIVGKSQRLHLRLEAAHSKAVGDVVRVQQVVWNLIRNASKFSKSETSIIVRTSNPAEKMVRIEVVDNGIGFEPSISKAIFEPFTQGGAEISNQFGGLGLGLTICKAIVEAHGGKIHGRSEGIGKGSVFVVDFPLSFRLPRPKRISHPGPTMAVAKSILLVEDHHDTRMSLEWMLQRDHHQVKSASTIKAALQLAQRNPFDLVIGDLGLPDGNGLDLMKQLRKDYKLPVIVLSGYGTDTDVSTSLTAGFSGHLLKPIRYEQLKHLIETLG